MYVDRGLQEIVLCCIIAKRGVIYFVKELYSENCYVYWAVNLVPSHHNQGHHPVKHFGRQNIF